MSEPAELRVEIPGELVEAIAHRAAELVRAELDGPVWLTLAEAAERYRTTPGALRWKAQRGRLPGAVKDGESKNARWLVNVRELDQALSDEATIRAPHKRGSHRANGRAPGTGGISSHAR